MWSRSPLQRGRGCGPRAAPGYDRLRPGTTAASLAHITSGCTNCLMPELDAQEELGPVNPGGWAGVPAVSGPELDLVIPLERQGQAQLLLELVGVTARHRGNGRAGVL